MTMINAFIVSLNYQKEHVKSCKKGFILVEHAVALILCSLVFLVGAVGVGGLLKLYTHAALYYKAHTYAVSSIQSWMCDVTQNDIDIDDRFTITIDETYAKLTGTDFFCKGKRCRVVVKWHDSIGEQQIIYQGFKASEFLKM